jgi:tetratricopeptide (TPR) repeat protein
MGSAFLERREFDLAIDVFKRMAVLMPENGSIANTLGYLLADQNKELPLAKDLVEKAIELDRPNRATYLDSLAWVEYRKGNFQKAWQIQNRALRIFKLTHEPVSSEVFLHMGKIQEKLKKLEDARVSYEAAIKSNTDAESVKIASESLHLLKDKQ